MATIKQNNINFTNIQPVGIFGVGARYSNSMNDDGTGKFDTSLTGDKISKSLNAVEIDWNGAQLKNGSTVKATLNTTGESLSN